MAHRSNQAVASQVQAAPQPPNDDPPPRRRILIGWATALAALGVSSGLIGGGLWLARFSIAELLIGAALAERGAEADFEVVALDLNHAVLNDVRFGAQAAPDAAMELVEARWSWRGLVPTLTAVRVIAPRVRLRLDGQGRVSAGALDHLQGRPSARRAAIAAIGVEIVDGIAMIDAPFGALQASFEANGVLGADFTARAVIDKTTRPGEAYALGEGAAELTIVSQDDGLGVQLYADAASLHWGALALEGASLRVIAEVRLDLSSYEMEAAWRADAIESPRIEARSVSGVLAADATAREDGVDPSSWRARLSVRAERLALADNTFFAPELDARLDADAEAGRGVWTLGAQRFSGLALNSQAPSAGGTFSLDWRDGVSMQGQARVVLAQSSLDARARQRLGAAIPDLAQAPIGPTFAAARAALERAADRFELTIPVRMRLDRTGARLAASAPVQALAASGARLALSPLRQDGPALQLELPALVLQGAVALELGGGGAPDMTLLLDTVSWTPDAPFEADGTLTLGNWRADNAEISADELGVSIVVRPNGHGAIDLRGPARVTGPLGDGEVRDLAINLDLTAQWGDGWSVRPTRNCLPVELGGIDAAGLSFANGRFSLCALHDALIAADARGRLSGGFMVQALALNGRMAGPDAQPAQLRSQRISGRFGGGQGDITLALVADAPTLLIDMADARTLSVAMTRLSADARIDESWSVEGAFERGALNDPTLPGSVSAIAGRWSAAPEDGKPVIRVTAAQAALTANRPPDDTQRPLFNPLRLVDIDAVLREGRIDADGAVLLADGARNLAHFSARHIVSEGVGGADIDAPEIVFGDALQPYDVSELARGVVENVRGPASAQVGAVWTRAQISTAALVRLNGVSLASATIPLIEDVRGEILFDDLLALTTPPGQEVRVGRLNPGVAVDNGRVRFQLLANGVIAIEAAEFAFASGVLSMRPETFTLGEDEQDVLLTLRDVDAGALIATLKIPDLEATGRIEGSFPMRLTRTSAIITNGALRAAPGGGRIAYTGQAGRQTTGVTRVAFDALRDFRYEVLSLTLNGDLNDEIVSDIEFTGENIGQPIDLSPIASLPGVGRVTMVGVPFRFNVKVTAPFRRLTDTAATILDPASLLRPDQTRAPEVAPEVDPGG